MFGPVVCGGVVCRILVRGAEVSRVAVCGAVVWGSGVYGCGIWVCGGHVWGLLWCVGLLHGGGGLPWGCIAALWWVVVYCGGKKSVHEGRGVINHFWGDFLISGKLILSVNF